MDIKVFKKINLPDKPGVYFFKKGKDTLYIGKATSLRSRVRSYFSNDLIVTRGPTIVDMVFKASDITWQETDSVLEALLLEAELIKKYQPHYNVQEKDDKSFNCVVITREDFPKVLVIRKRILLGDEFANKKYQAIYGPFTNGMQLREALKIVRRIFPFIDLQSAKKDNSQFYRQIGLSPDITNEEAKEIYKNTIKNLKLFFQGKKKEIVRNMKREMKDRAEKREFEYAAMLRNRIFALEHINDISLLKEDPITSFEKKYFQDSSYPFRIESYDIAHMSGKSMVGVMTVVEDGQVAKHEYKKFKIRTQSGANDTGALYEMLSRRLKHTEWQYPNLIVVDGSTAQINIAKRAIKEIGASIPIVSVIKDERHKAKDIGGDEVIGQKHEREILLANSEAHRFAIAYHIKTRNNNFLK